MSAPLCRRLLAVLVVLAFLGLSSSGTADDDASKGLAGIPFPATEAVYLSPCPVAATVRQGNGGSFSHSGRSHYAWDFTQPIGTPVVAARAGVVRSVRQNSAVGGGSKIFGPHGNRIVVDHLDGTGAVYLHLVHGGARVGVGEYVIRGEVLALSGDTGWSTDAHLHYAVVEIPSTKTIPSCFAGFDANDGVPEKGQALEPAPPPAVKQATLDLYKETWRSAETAVQLERPILAWLYLTSVPGRRRVAAYYYDRVLGARAAELRATTVAVLRSLLETPEPAPGQALTAYECVALLPRVKDEEIRGLHRRVAEWIKTWPAASKKTWRHEAAAVSHWIAGLRAECEADTEAARKAYAKARSTTRGTLHSAADASLRRLATRWGRELDARLKRRGIEVKIVEKPHHKRWLEQDLKAFRGDAQRLRKLHAKHWTHEAAVAASHYARREDERKRLLQLLRGR